MGIQVEYRLLVYISSQLFACADWLVRKWIASTFLLRAADETKSRDKSLNSDHFTVY